MSERIFNFSAGPAVLPVSVLERARDEMLNFEGSGMAVMEMSHRSQVFEDIIHGAEAGLRKHLGIPEEYEVLFLQGGATLQFSMIPMNLYLQSNPVDVIHTGAWTKKAIIELEKLAAYRIAASTEAENFIRLPNPDEISLNENASYIHLCSNNTIFGTQWRGFPDMGQKTVVADMSSDILSRPIDVSKFGLIFAGAQKNIGPSGVTIVIMQPELAERASQDQPTMLQYRTHIKAKSLFNTPPTFGIYMISLVMDWIEAEGGLTVIEQRNEAQAQKLYAAIDNSDFYQGSVLKQDRSRMNVVFRIQNGDEDLEKKFVVQAAANRMTNLKGHRSTGGIRASIYNAQTDEAIEALVSFMQSFEAKNG